MAQRKDNLCHHKCLKSKSATKKDPGRVHQEGRKKRCRFGMPVSTRTVLTDRQKETHHEH